MGQQGGALVNGGGVWGRGGYVWVSVLLLVLLLHARKTDVFLGFSE